MPLDIYAHPQHLVEWGPGRDRSRYDYDSPDHLLAEMQQMGEAYFGRYFCDRLRAGDIVYVTDAAKQRATLIIAHVDKARHMVDFDVDALHVDKIVIAKGQDMTVRWRGSRGGSWCIVDRAGTVIARDALSRAEAERRLANLREAKAA